MTTDPLAATDDASVLRRSLVGPVVIVSLVPLVAQQRHPALRA